MNKILTSTISITFLIFSIISQQVWGLDCLPADIELSTQSQVDDFDTAYGGCTEITGYLKIRGDDILNLDGLSNLTSVGGYLRIDSNPVLTNIDGIANITSVGGYMRVSYNAALIDIEGLSKITNVEGEGLYIEGNAVLTNLNGLANLINVTGDVGIGKHAALTNIDGLSSLTNVGGSFKFWNNALTNLDALANLISVGSNVVISDNVDLASCTGLTRLMDEIDDGDPGPGPGVAGVPDVGRDVVIENNAIGCNSIEDTILTYVQVPIPAVTYPGIAILVLLTLLGGFVGFRRLV